MGIFEKSIPKYVVNPIDQQVEVVPQDVYVDDIFDPIFNANVRNAMRQKYGGGLYGVLGGYEEMLKNAWGGSGGILGKGMGVLSTFGRSMEKADDIVLGALTEGIEGITGQGFDNPFKKIFVDDEDYTGKRLLAATANTFRGLAGTSVTEEDFGTAWNIPALGAELATDVGILGSGLSRKLAPKAHDFTSKELFQNLGKSDLKTTVGEIGQLMSNYDDLMTRVAIDITAPGLRPAFRGLRSKLVQHFATHSPREFVDIEFIRRHPEVLEDAAKFRANEPVAQMVDNLEEIEKTIPEPVADVANVASAADVANAALNVAPGFVDLPYLIDEESLAEHEYLKNLLDSRGYINVNNAVRDLVSKYADEIEKLYLEEGIAYGKGIEQMLERMKERGIDVTQIGFDQYSDKLPSTVNSIQDLKHLHIAKERFDMNKAYEEMHMLEEAGRDSDHVLRSIELIENYDRSMDELRKVVQQAVGVTESVPTAAVKLTKDEQALYAMLMEAALEDNTKLADIKKAYGEFKSKNPILSKDAKLKFHKEHNTQFYRDYGTSYEIAKTFPNEVASLAYKLRQNAVAGRVYDDIYATVPKSMRVKLKDTILSSEESAELPAWLFESIRKKEAPEEVLEYYESTLRPLKENAARKRRALQDFENSRTKRSKEDVEGVNPQYVDEVLEKLENDDILLDALESGEWSTNDAINKAVLSALGDPSHKHSLWYASANPKYTVSPSRYNIINKIGALGANIAQLRLHAARYAFRDPSKIRFANEEELLKYLNTTKMTTAIQEYFPKTRPERRAIPLDNPIVQEIMLNPKYADKMDAGLVPVKVEPVQYNSKTAAKYRNSDKADKYYLRMPFDETSTGGELYRITWAPEYRNAKVSVDDIRQAIVNAYFPKGKYGDSTVIEYISKLETLSKLLDDSLLIKPTTELLKYAPDQSAFLDDLYKAFDDSVEIDNVYNMIKTIPGHKLNVYTMPGVGTVASARTTKGALRDAMAKHPTKFYGIDQTVLQKIRHETPSAKGARLTASTDTYSLDGNKISQRINNLDAVGNLTDDFSTSYDAYVKSILSQVAPHIKTDEDLLYFVEPILGYIQVMPSNVTGKIDDVRKYLSNVTGITKNNIPEELLNETLLKNRLGISETTSKVVDKFRTEVYPRAHAYLKKYGDFSKMPPKGASAEQWKEFYTVRSLLGYSDKKTWLDKYGIPQYSKRVGYANRLMFNSLVDAKTGKDLIAPNNLYARTLAVQDAAMRARVSAKFNDPKLELRDEFSEIAEKYRAESVTAANAARAERELKEAMASKPVEEVAEESFDNLSTASATADKAIEELAEDMKNFVDSGGTAEAGKQIYGERRWRWFEIINDSVSVSNKNARRLERASIRTKKASALVKRFRDYVNRIFVRDGASKSYSNLKRFYILRQQELGDIVSGKDFWTVFRRTGMLAAPYKTGSKQMTDTLTALTKNAEIINKAAGKNIVEVATEDIGLGRSVVVFRFTGDKNTVKYVKKASKKLASAQYSDVVFSPPKALTGAERAFMDGADARELSGLMEDLQSLAGEQAKLLGFQFDNVTPYTHHTMRRDKNTASWLDTHFYSKMSSEEYDEMSKLISNFDEYRKTDRGAFGTMLQDRRYRGAYWMFDIDGHNPVFDYNPTNIFTSTLVDGMFANLQYQDFTDLFINDNFKIKGVFETVEDLKKVLYAKDSKGRLSGNFANSELVSYKLDENGRLTGLVKYDKATDAGLKKALADPNTILVPANAISYMDNVLRKDVRMNNKFWTFINKHFTIPFKFGLLSNPGFLLGNISDSTFKLATTMSEKYGTPFTKEAANVAECLNASMALKNEYYEAFNVWKNVSLEYDIRLSPEALIPDIVAMSPKYKETFLEWLNGTLEVPYKYQNEAGMWITEYRKVPCELPDSVVDNASIWTMLQGVQMSSSKMREYADLAEISPTSNFNVATNAFDRVTQGSGAYDPKKPSTWGVYMNNPPMKKLTGLSAGWEDLIRTASILDDLRHGQYSKEDFAIFARGHKGGDDAIKMRVRLDEAKNTMFNAQFDYERQSDFISKIGKTVPFPIFFLKNFEYWMEMLENNPQFIDNVIDVQEGLWSGYNEEGDEFKTEAKGRGAIPVGGKALPDWFKGIYKPSPLQSMFGAFSLLNNPVDDLSYRTHPLIGGAKATVANMMPDSELTTLLSDPDSVKYRPYSTDMYERNIKQGDPNFSPAAYTLHRMNPYDRAMSAHLRIPEKAKAGELQMSDVLPSVFQPVF